MPSSDHLPLQAEIDVDFNCAFNLIDVNTCPRDIVSYKWSQCTPHDLYQYCCSTYALFSDIYVTPGVKCNNPDCNLASHKSDIDCLYKKIVTVWKMPANIVYHQIRLIIIKNILCLVLTNM